jgi:hypothetical protein
VSVTACAASILQKSYSRTESKDLNWGIKLFEGKSVNTYQSRFTLPMTALYFVLTFAITWAILIPALSSVPEESLTPFFVPAAFGPFLAAIVVMGIYWGRSGLIQWLRQVFKIRIPIVLYLAGAFFLPIGIGASHYSLYRVLGGRSDLSAAMPWFYYPINLLLVTLLLGGNEEPGEGSHYLLCLSVSTLCLPL